MKKVFIYEREGEVYEKSNRKVTVIFLLHEFSYGDSGEGECSRKHFDQHPGKIWSDGRTKNL